MRELVRESTTLLLTTEVMRRSRDTDLTGWTRPAAGESRRLRARAAKFSSASPKFPL
jgi:hypothetical protein